MLVGDLPLAMAQSPDGRYLFVVANGGFNKPTLVCVDLERRYVSSRFTLDDAWLGFAWSPSGDRLYASGGAARAVREILFREGEAQGGQDDRARETGQGQEDF